MSRSLAPDDRTKVLEALRAGVDRPTAAQYIGLEPATFEQLIASTTALRLDVEAAEATARVASVGAIAKAAKGGDWRAASFLLERKPAPPPAPRECGATTRQGARCGLRRGFGTDHPGSGRCKHHGGSTSTGKKAAAREAATVALERLGVPIETDPQTALLGQVWEAMGNVAFLRGQVQALGTAVAGPDHLGDARSHVLVAMYNEERDRLAKICRLAIDAGIAERAIAIAEFQADAIVSILSRVLDSLGLPRAKRDQAQGIAVAALREFADLEVLAVNRQPAGARN